MKDTGWRIDLDEALKARARGTCTFGGMRRPTMNDGQMTRIDLTQRLEDNGFVWDEENAQYYLSHPVYPDDPEYVWSVVTLAVIEETDGESFAALCHAVEQMAVQRLAYASGYRDALKGLAVDIETGKTLVEMKPYIVEHGTFNVEEDEET